MLSPIRLIGLVVLGSSISFMTFIVIAEAQTYKISDSITHIKFINSTDYNSLSVAVNTFITDKTFNSPSFKLVSIELVDVNTVMITYTDTNEITPSVITDAIERSKQEELDAKNNITEIEEK